MIGDNLAISGTPNFYLIDSGRVIFINSSFEDSGNPTELKDS